MYPSRMFKFHRTPYLRDIIDDLNSKKDDYVSIIVNKGSAIGKSIGDIDIKEKRLQTEEGNPIIYNNDYYVCYHANSDCLKGTIQERELYKPYKCTFHKGSTINMYGIKIFNELTNAQVWCNDNKK